MAKNLVLMICVAILLGTMACGDDESDKSRHGVSGSKQLKDLTQEEIEQICDDIELSYEEAWFNAMSPFIVTVCIAQAYLRTFVIDGSKTDCEIAKQECVEQASSSNQNLDQLGIISLGCAMLDERFNCDATVAELDSCTAATKSAMRSGAIEIEQVIESNPLIGSIDCQDYGEPIEWDLLNDFSFDTSNFGLSLSQLQVPEQCQRLYDKCPGF